MRLSLRGKIFAYIALPVVLILGGAQALRVKQLSDEATESTIERARTRIVREARLLDSRLREVARIARDTASFLELHPELDKDRLFELVRVNVAADRLVYGAAIAFLPSASPTGGLFAPYAFRKSGTAIETMDIGRDGYDYTAARWQWWRRPLERGFGVWTDAYLDEGAGNVWMVTFSAPFRRDGIPVGVATVDVALPTLRALVFDAEAARRKLFVVGADMRMVFAHNSADIGTPLQTIAERDGRSEIVALGRKMLADAPGYTVAPGWESAEPQWIFYAPVYSSGWVLGQRVDERRVFGTVRARALDAAIGLAVTLVIIGLAALVVTRRLTAPLARLDVAAHRVAQGDMNIDLPGTGTDDDRATAWGSVVTGKPSSDPDSAPFPVAPTGYSLLWKGTNGSDSASIWAPIPPAGYVACGHVVQKGYAAPATSLVSCLSYSDAVQVEIGPLIWSQTNATNPQYDVTVFRVSQLGTVFAVPTLVTPPAGLTVYVPSNVARTAI